ncbi:uncharacterized protein [Onthophagus taurus]|uniref:uncharacterized protein n=1 Tax=Onthophagus taurus TaxID=166361 RepID=UPI0039BDDE79
MCAMCWKDRFGFFVINKEDDMNDVIRTGGELHLPGYQFCGPGTNLMKRLARGDPGINKLDRACKRHDLAYTQYTDLHNRHKADKVLAEEAWKRVLAKDSSFGEKANAWFVTNAMKVKRKLGFVPINSKVNTNFSHEAFIHCKEKIDSKQLTRKLIKTRENVKKKLDKLKAMKHRSEHLLQEQYKVVTTPLQKIISSIKHPIKVKKEEEEDEELKSDEVKEEEEFKTVTPAKRRKRVSKAVQASRLSELNQQQQQQQQAPQSPTISILSDDDVFATYPSPPQPQPSQPSQTAAAAVDVSSLPETMNIPEESFVLYLEQFAPLTRSYIEGYVRDDNNEFDSSNKGVRVDILTDKYSIGDSEISFSSKTNDITIANKTYKGTKGLYELIFKREPENFTSDDQKNYVEILKTTAALNKNQDKSKQIIGDKSDKYRQIIAPVLNATESIVRRSRVKSVPVRLRTGEGLMQQQYNNQRSNFIYWDDPNELVDRLKLLIASQLAGNTSHGNEINSIIEELREARIIV